MMGRIFVSHPALIETKFFWHAGRPCSINIHTELGEALTSSAARHDAISGSFVKN